MKIGIFKPDGWMLVLLIIGILFISIPASAEVFDVWSGWHFMGSFMLVHTLNYCGMDLTTSWFVAFGLGILWEVADVLFGDRFPSFLDSRRLFDPRDVLCDFAGCTLRIYFDRRAD